MITQCDLLIVLVIVTVNWACLTMPGDYNICDAAMFCALHDQLASLDRHAQLTRCFSAVAGLLVHYRDGTHSRYLYTNVWTFN